MIKVLAFPAFSNKESNPYNYLLYTGIEKQDVDVKEFSFKRCLSLNYDLIHIHWPEFFLNSHYILKACVYSFVFLFCLFYSRIFGKKIVWTVHNLKPHNVKYRRLNKIFWSCFTPLVDGVISLSKANEKLFLDKFSLKKEALSTAVYHGLYDGFYNKSISKQEAKKFFSLDESKKVCLFLGQVKAYKNVEALVKLFNEESSLSNAVLIVAGKFESKAYYDQVCFQAQGNENIIIHNKFIFDDDLQYYFNASDVCLLPFKNIFNSGSVLLSASFNTPVLVPSSDNFIEYAKMLKPNMITTYKDTLSLSDITNLFERLEQVSSISEDSTNQDSSALCWTKIQHSLADFYKVIQKV